MKKNIPISKTRLWLATITSYIFFFYFIYVQAQDIECSSLVEGFGIGIIISTVVLLVSDIIKNNVYNKRFWLLSMFIFTPISALVYLIKREKLIYLGDKNKYQNSSSAKNTN